MNRFIFIISFVICLPAFAGGADWPSAEQIKLVESRKATFPYKTLVADVDWYEPLEIVKGRTDADSLPVNKHATDYSGALALLEKFNNYAFIVWKDGAIQYETYWPGFNAESRYATASMHKTVVATVFGIAYDEGLIDSVDDPLQKYLTELAGDKRGAIPLRALLEMASGITTPGFSDDLASPYWQTYFGNDLKTAISHWPMPYEPFDEFSYANANTQYLGWVIERVTGQRYADYLSSKLWQPMGAADARVWLDHQGGMPRMSCCLHASARDWLRFGLLLLNKGAVGKEQVVSAEWIEKMTAPSAKNGNYGWQIWRASPYNPERSYGKDIPVLVPAAEPFKRADTVYLDGSGGQRVYIVPSENMVIVRIGAPAPNWDDSALPNVLLTK